MRSQVLKITWFVTVLNVEMELKFSILFKFQLVNMVENPGIDDRAKQEPCPQIQCLKRDPPTPQKHT